MISLKTISYQCNQMPLDQLLQDFVIRNRPPISLPSLGFHKPCPYSPTAFPLQPGDSQPLQHAFLMQCSGLSVLAVSFQIVPMSFCKCIVQNYRQYFRSPLGFFFFFIIEEWFSLFCSVLSVCAGDTQHFVGSLGCPSTMSWWSQRSLSAKDPFSEL